MPQAPSTTAERTLLAAAVGGLCLAVLGPALPRLHAHLLGRDFVDLKGTAWFYWLVEDALRSGSGLARTDRVFHPWGKDLFGHTGSNFLDAIVVVPFRVLLGPVLGYNLAVLLGLLLTGLALERLLRHLAADRLVSGIGAALLVLGPWILFDLAEGRPTQAVLVLPVLFLSALWRLGEERGLRWPLLAGLCLALTGYQYWYYALFAGLAALGHGLACLAQPPPDSGGRRAVLGRHALAAGVAVLLVAPAALPLLSGSATGQLPGLLDPSSWTWQAQPTVTPQGENIAMFAWHPLADVAGYVAEGPGGEVLRIALHPVPLLAWPFVAAGLWLAGPRRLRLVALLVPPALLALGPTLVVGDLAVLNPVYKALTQALPVLRRLWWPARAMAVLQIPAAMAAVLALAALRRRWPMPGAVVAVLLVVFHAAHLQRDFLLGLTTWDPAPPAGYRCLAQGPEGAILELPYGGHQDHLVWQSAHGRALFGGPAERNPELVPEQTRALLRENAWLNQLVRLVSGPEVLGVDAGVPPRDRAGWSVEDRDAVGALGFRYVVVQRDELTPEPGRDRKLRRLLGEPVYADARVEIHAPWGGDSPCAADPVAPDAAPKPDVLEPWRAAMGKPSAALTLRRPGQPAARMPPPGRGPPPPPGQAPPRDRPR